MKRPIPLGQLPINSTIQENFMICFRLNQGNLIGIPFELSNAIYLEGGYTVTEKFDYRSCFSFLN